MDIREDSKFNVLENWGIRWELVGFLTSWLSEILDTTIQQSTIEGKRSELLECARQDCLDL